MPRVTPVRSLAAIVLPADDLATCRRLLAVGSQSFAAAAALLPARLRAPAAVFYAFCRQADDAVDAPDINPRDAVVALQARLEQIYAWAADEGWQPEGRSESEALAVDRCLALVVRRWRLPRAVFDALIEGFVWDAQDREYATYDELVGYCARVASSVGVVMTLLMDTRDVLVLARACELGLAMQLTNIARDVGEDARRGRVYLPTQWLNEASLEREAVLGAQRCSPALAQVIKRLLAHADWAYRRAEHGISGLPEDCRPAIRAARLIYAAIGDVLSRRGYDSVTRRAVTSRWLKIRLLLRARLRRCAGETRELKVATSLHRELAVLLVDIDGYAQLNLSSGSPL